jgi:cbb3-type cytochrome oxidase subunit 3
MDVNDIRDLVTLLSFSFFLGLMAWTYWPGRRDDFAAAEQLPFVGEVGEVDDDARQGARNE